MQNTKTKPGIAQRRKGAKETKTRFSSHYRYRNRFSNDAFRSDFDPDSDFDFDFG